MLPFYRPFSLFFPFLSLSSKWLSSLLWFHFLYLLFSWLLSISFYHCLLSPVPPSPLFLFLDHFVSLLFFPISPISVSVRQFSLPSFLDTHLNSLLFVFLSPVFSKLCSLIWTRFTVICLSHLIPSNCFHKWKQREKVQQTRYIWSNSALMQL